MCGIGAAEFPAIRQVKFGKEQLWASVGSPLPYTSFLEDDALLNLQDEQVFGVIGYQGWQTYLAAAYMLPVIEILPEGADRDLLSKWRNPHYRLISDAHYVVPTKLVLEIKLGKMPKE
jgi:hypothetical protein